MTGGRSTVLITGASSGLGAGMARLFAAKGYDLALCARRLEPLAALKAELAVHGGRVEIRALDVNNHAGVFHTFEDLAVALGGLDRVVVNAGVGTGGRLGTGRFDRNLATAETNFVAALAQSEAALVHFRARQAGHLVLVASMSAVRGLPGGMAVYAASKAALTHLGEGLSIEFRSSPIRVTTLLPGYIRTPLNAGTRPLPFEVDEQTGVAAMVRAIEKQKAVAHVPPWPWTALALVLKQAPLSMLGRGV